MIAFDRRIARAGAFCAGLARLLVRVGIAARNRAPLAIAFEIDYDIIGIGDLGGIAIFSFWILSHGRSSFDPDQD
jgi:hypothetical protein